MATKYPTIMELNEVSKETIQQQYLAASIANCTPKTPFSYSYIFSRLANDRDEIQHWIKDGIADASIQNTGNSNYRIRCKTEVFNMDLKQDYDIDLFISVLAPPWDHESIEVGTKGDSRLRGKAVGSRQPKTTQAS